MIVSVDIGDRRVSDDSEGPEMPAGEMGKMVSFVGCVPHGVTLTVLVCLLCIVFSRFLSCGVACLCVAGGGLGVGVWVRGGRRGDPNNPHAHTAMEGGGGEETPSTPTPGDSNRSE